MEGYRQQALSYFSDGRVPANRPSMLYVLGLFIVALVLVALPVIYLGLIALGGYGIYYHAAAHFKPIFEFAKLGHVFIKLFAMGLYFGPILGGCVILLFMVKPLFAPKGREPDVFGLNPESEPLLCAFIEEICDRVGAPRPALIELSPELNASASFRGGTKGVLGGDLVLTIGMPLIVGLNVSQFAAVVAHEFGHFNQGGAMRISYFVRTVQRWIARVAFERDGWDEALEDWGSEGELGVFEFFLLVMIRTGVGLSRLILGGLAIASQWAVGFMLRQMEYSADRGAVAIAGSPSFESLIMRLAVLGRAMEYVNGSMRQSLKKEGRLPSSMAALLSRQVDAISEKVRKNWEGKEGLVRTRVFDTHPAASDRIRESRRQNREGIVTSTARAMDLFHDFEIPAHYVTILYYQYLFGVPIPPEALYDVSVKSDAIPFPDDYPIVVNRFYFGLLEWRRPFSLVEADLELGFDGERAKKELVTIRPQIESIEADVTAVTERLFQSKAECETARTDALLVSVGLADQAESDVERAEAELQRLNGKLDPVWEALKRRVACGFLALGTESVKDFMPNGKSAARQVSELLGILHDLQEAYPTVVRLGTCLSVLQPLLESEAADTKSSRSKTRQIQAMGDCRKTLGELEERFAKMPYLFGSAEKSISFWQYASRDLAPLGIGNVQAVATMGEAIHAESIEYHDALAAALALLVEQLETYLHESTT